MYILLVGISRIQPCMDLMTHRTSYLCVEGVKVVVQDDVLDPKIITHTSSLQSGGECTVQNESEGMVTKLIHCTGCD